MPEQRSPETRTPQQIIVDDFYMLFNDHSLTEGNIRAHIAPLLEMALPATDVAGREYQQRLLDNWSQRFTEESTYIMEGALLEEPEPIDEVLQIELKVGLLADATGVLVASERSALTDSQKRQLIVRTLACFKNLGMNEDIAKEDLGSAIAPFVAHEVERASLATDREQYIARGRAALGFIQDFGLLPPGRRRSLRGMLRHPDRHADGAKETIRRYASKVL